MPFALLTPGLALAEGGPTPESSGTIPLTQRYSLLFRRTSNGIVVSAKSDPKFWNEPNLTVGQVVSAISNKFGIADQKSCAFQVVVRNDYNIETEATAQRRLNKKEVLPSERQIVIESAQTVIDFINACSLKAKQVIQTVLPSVTAIPPSKIAPPTVMATRIPASSTPVKLPTTTSTPQAEVPSKTDTRENIKYVLGGALVLALLGLGSLAALVVHNSKNKKKEENLSPAILRHLPNETQVIDQRVIQLSGEGQSFNIYMGDGAPERPAIFEPNVLVIETEDSNLLQRVLSALAKAIKREDPNIVRAKIAALMHHEGDHARNTSVGVAVIGRIRDPHTKKVIGAVVQDPNFDATAEERRKMALAPDDPTEHDERIAKQAEDEIKKRKK